MKKIVAYQQHNQIDCGRNYLRLVAQYYGRRFLVAKVLSEKLMLPFVLFSFIGYAQSVPFVIRGKLGKLDAPAKLYLVRKEVVVDSAQLQQGLFEFRSRCDEFEKVTILLQPSGRANKLNLLSSLLDKVDVFLVAGAAKLISEDSLMNAVVSGSGLAEKNSRLQVSLRPNCPTGASH